MSQKSEEWLQYAPYMAAYGSIVRSADACAIRFVVDDDVDVCFESFGSSSSSARPEAMERHAVPKRSVCAPPLCELRATAQLGGGAAHVQAFFACRLNAFDVKLREAVLEKIVR
ncbi:unnamed protein product [Caenorhabditis brenneri]